ncbi:MAG: SDR family NAD(P)-dependent oxidoreductase [Egibacteraceae bacterium]
MADPRLAVVTGGSRGIGRATAAALLRAGHRVVVTGRDQDALDKAAAALAGLGEVQARAFDVTDEDAVDRWLRPLAADVLVNNAGAATSAPVERTTLDDWSRMLAVNATGAFLCTRAVLGGMRARDRGRIVTVASVAGLVGGRYIAAYTAAKHAAVGLMRVVAAEVAGSGVTANAVCPAFVRSRMTEESVARIAELTGRSLDEAQAALERATPLGRLLEPEEVAAAVAYLVSEQAAAVNGQTIVIDGGGIRL